MAIPSELIKYTTRKYNRVISRHYLMSKHAEFIDMVKDKGTGSIVYQDLGGGVGKIVLSNPSEKNAMSGRMMHQLGRIVDDLYTSKKRLDEPLGLIITGVHDYFCSGLSITLAKETINTPDRGVLMASYMTDVLTTIRQSRSVSLTLMNGPAIGGGAELSTTTDFRLMKQLSYIQFVHAHIGASPGWGGIQRLMTIVGRNRALRLLASGVKISPSTAIEIGLVDELIPSGTPEELDEAAKVFFQKMFNHSYPDSIKVIKEVVGASESHHHNFIAEKELQAFKSRWFCVDNVEAINKFLNSKKGS